MVPILLLVADLTLGSLLSCFRICFFFFFAVVAFFSGYREVLQSLPLLTLDILHNINCDILLLLVNGMYIFQALQPVLWFGSRLEKT